MNGDPIAPPTPQPPAAVPPGPTGPATVPPDMAGRRMQGYLRATIGMNALEQAAGLFGGTASEEGREILAVLVKLRGKFGSAAPDVQQQELKSLGEGIPPVQSPSPMQGQALQDAIRQKQQSQGMPSPVAA